MRKRLDLTDIIAIAGFLMLLLVGILTVTDYGISTDEPPNYRVGLDALKALKDPIGYTKYMEHGEPIAQHGPSYFMIYANVAKAFTEIIPQWHIADARHFVNFLTFVFGIICFYALVRRVLKKPYAIISTAFFATQPLFWGHAFINQKDMPFFVFFTAGFLMGVHAIDAIVQFQAATVDPGKTLTTSLRSDWKSLPRSMRITLLAGAFVLIVFGLDFLVFETSLAGSLLVLERLYSGDAWQPAVQAFRFVAEDWQRAPFEAYALRLRWVYWWGRALVLMADIFILWLFGNKFFPSIFGGNSRFQRNIHFKVLIAGSLLGFTISIRPLAGFLGLLVSLYWLLEAKGKRPGLLVIYWLIAGLTTYVTWPFLWDAPVERLFESLLFTTQYEQATKYFGQILTSSQLPWHYFPALSAIRLTEFATPFFIAGIAISLFNYAKRKKQSDLILLMLIWLFVPFLALVLFDVTIYGNIRHLLFMLIPVLLFAGIGIQAIGDYLGQRGSFRYILFAILLIPNLLGIIRLHPYQYAYFNSYIGGVRGAGDQFTLDRWCTSYREAMSYLNEVAEPNSVVAALQAPQAAEPFARVDLIVSQEIVEPPRNTRYLLTCLFYLEEYRDNPKWEKLHTISLNRIPLAEVYQRQR